SHHALEEGRPSRQRYSGALKGGDVESHRRPGIWSDRANAQTGRQQSFRKKDSQSQETGGNYFDIEVLRDYRDVGGYIEADIRRRAVCAAHDGEDVSGVGGIASAD